MKFFRVVRKNLDENFLRALAFSTLIGGSFLATLGLNVVPAAARPSLPMYLHVQAGYSESDMVVELTVPDRNTTTRLKGSQLRRYDAHIAKMFEFTNYECRNTPDRQWNTIQWEYSAGNGKIDMGKFYISCDRARKVAATYGLGKSQRTEVYYHKAKNMVSVPSLNISGKNTSKWLSFVQTFLPQR